MSHQPPLAGGDSLLRGQAWGQVGIYPPSGTEQLRRLSSAPAVPKGGWALPPALQAARGG